MVEQLYPRVKKTRTPNARKPWRVYYSNMAYDGGGSASFIRSYWTRWGARYSAFLEVNIRAWGGKAILKHRSEFDV